VSLPFFFPEGFSSLGGHYFILLAHATAPPGSPKFLKDRCVGSSLVGFLPEIPSFLPEGLPPFEEEQLLFLSPRAPRLSPQVNLRSLPSIFPPRVFLLVFSPLFLKKNDKFLIDELGPTGSLLSPSRTLWIPFPHFLGRPQCFPFRHGRHSCVEDSFPSILNVPFFFF